MRRSITDFTLIYQDYKALVYNVALQYVQNIEDAEEILQDVFVKVHQSLVKFENKSTLKTWIYRITINQSLDFIKKKKSKRHFFMFGRKSDSDYEVNNISTFEHPGILMEHKEEAKILFDIISTLPDTQKTAFILSKIDGLSNPEVAEIMQTSVSSIESLLFRAKKSLQEKLSHKFEDTARNNNYSRLKLK